MAATAPAGDSRPLPVANAGAVLRRWPLNGDANRLIVVMLVLETVPRLTALGLSFGGLRPPQLSVAVPLTIGLYFLGTVPPPTIFVQARPALSVPAARLDRPASTGGQRDSVARQAGRTTA